MNNFYTDGSFMEDFRIYTDLIQKFGASSPISEREVISLAEEGNVVALKAYGDLFFNHKVMRKYPYRDAFSKYLSASGITFAVNGGWQSSGKSYPTAFWMVGYYLFTYHMDGLLLNCESIPAIERLTRPERLAMALQLAKACIDSAPAPGAYNLIGRILTELSEDAALSAEMDLDLESLLTELHHTPITTVANDYFVKAAECGYVYACNNLATREISSLLTLEDASDMNRDTNSSPDQVTDQVANQIADQIAEHIKNYIHYLTIAADRFEPYAANRLGLFYLQGQIQVPGESRTLYYKDYCNVQLAKEYFTKATIHPDINSAWAYFNLIKFFPKDYSANIDLLNEHMEYIKQLNPDVYDIAIEL